MFVPVTFFLHLKIFVYSSPQSKRDFSKRNYFSLIRHWKCKFVQNWAKVKFPKILRTHILETGTAEKLKISGFSYLNDRSNDENFIKKIHLKGTT